MPFLMNCPSCSARLRIPDVLGGRRCRCPKCGLEFRAPSLEGQPAEPRPSSPRVFISHDSTDRQFVEKEIKPLLESHGINRWWSEESIPTGADWEAALQAGLEESDWFLVILSPRSVESPWVKREVQRALAEKPGRVIPVLMEKCDRHRLHPRLALLQFADFSASAEVAGRKVLACIIGRLNKESRQAKEKIAQLSEDCERLSEETSQLRQQIGDLTGELHSVENWDGNWTRPGDPPPDASRPDRQRKAPIIALLNFKGGVGKSTLTANLGATRWSDDRHPAKVLVVDLDYQGSLTKICLSRQEQEDCRRQGRLLDKLFTTSNLGADFVFRNASRVGSTRGYVLPADIDLLKAEALAQARWLTGRGPADERYLLRNVLHSDGVQQEFDLILLDCPPRLTTACVNALTCCDHVLIPVLLDQTSADAVPRLLASLRQLRPKLFPGLSVLGVVANRVGPRDGMLIRERDLWQDLGPNCSDAWQEPVHLFETTIRQFTEAARQRQFPALHPDLRESFRALAEEMSAQIGQLREVEP